MINLFVATSVLVSDNLFAKAFGGDQNDRGVAITQATDGNYLVLSETWSFGAVSGDFMVMKLGLDGSVNWATIYGGSSSDYPYSIIKSSDGGCAAVGTTTSFGTGGFDIFVLKLNSSGGLGWARTFGAAGTSEDRAHSIIQTSDGGYAISGYIFPQSPYYELVVLKLNSSGNLQWAKKFGGTDWTSSSSIIQTTDGGYAFAGTIVISGAGMGDFLVLKLNSSGDLQWAKTFGGTQQDYAYSIVQTSDGGYAVTGYTMSFGAGLADFMVLKLNSSGDLQWAKTLGGNQNDYGISIIQASGGELLITGSTLSFGDQDFLIVKLNSSGDLQWARHFDIIYNDGPASMINTADGGYAIAGGTWDFGAGGWDCVVLKLGSDGNYPGCLLDCLPSVSEPPISVSTILIGEDFAPTVTIPNPTITAVNPTTTDACQPIEIEEENLSGSKPGITCSPFFGGILFKSPTDFPIKIYSADGRVAYSGQLQKGENRIALGQGVYLWQAGDYRGKVAVR